MKASFTGLRGGNQTKRVHAMYIKPYKYTLIHSDSKQIIGHRRNEGGGMGRVPSPAGDRFTVSIGMVSQLHTCTKFLTVYLNMWFIIHQFYFSFKK